MKTLLQKNRAILAVIALFLLNLVFNFQTLRDIYLIQFRNKEIVNDSLMTEFALNNNYGKITSFTNPFKPTNKIFYPYEVDLSVYGFSPNTSLIGFLFLRPFLKPLTIFLTISFFDFFLSTLFMYLLLGKFKIGCHSRFIASLIFAFSPYLSYQVFEQYSYTAIFYFPLIVLLIYSFAEASRTSTKIFCSILIGLASGILFFSNIYYFLITAFLFFIYIISLVLSQRKILFNFIYVNWKYIMPAIIIFFFNFIFWSYLLFRWTYFSRFDKVSGFGGAITLSADLVNFFIPSEYNPFYRTIIVLLQDKSPLFLKFANFYFHNQERFAYPGIIIVAVYLYLFFFRRKLPKNLWLKIKPYFVISLFFALLSMGPFLKIANRWSINLEGVAVVFPLPFLLLHYLPLFDSIRAPARFIPMFVFLGAIVSAFLLNYFFQKMPAKKRRYVLILLYAVFFFDQFYLIPERTSAQLPTKAYLSIKNDSTPGTVLEIPFTVRDGLQYSGFVHAITPMKGALIHKKPVIGGYLPRVHDYVFDYYKNLPFIGYVESIIDKGNYNPYKEKPQAVKLTPFTGDYEAARKEVDFLNIKYILLKTDEKYSPVIEKIITQVGFAPQMKDGKYELYATEPEKKSFEQVNFGSKSDYLFTAAGFSKKEAGFRWTEGDLIKIFVKTYETNNRKLKFTVSSFHQPQKIKVYLNQKYLGAKMIDTQKQTYEIELGDQLQPEINTFLFKPSKQFKPADVLPNSQDQRNLALKFYSVELE